MISSHDSIPCGTARQQQSTTLLLVRHAHTSATGVSLSGRAADVPLSLHGRAQLRDLCAALHQIPIAAVYSSPLERARATAEALAEARSLIANLNDDLVEVDFGEWTGRMFAELERSPEWQTFNRCRSTTQIPGGEHPAAVADRAVRALDAIQRAHPGQTIVVVSHAEIIRSAVLRYLGYSLDLFCEIHIPTASITRVVFEANDACVVAVGGVALPGSVVSRIRR
jgi:probable phosphoglycerate mutase